MSSTWASDDGRHLGGVSLRFNADAGKAGAIASPLRLTTSWEDATMKEIGVDQAQAFLDTVIGWGLECQCTPLSSAGPAAAGERRERWSSGLLMRRVSSAAEEDLEDGRLYCGPGISDVVDATDRPDVDAIMRAAWLRTHVAGAKRAVAVRRSSDAVTRALQDLDQQVAAGRDSGLSWADIGLAAGMSETAARERWGTSRP